MNLAEKMTQFSDQELAEMLGEKSFLRRAAAIDELGERLQKNFNDKQFDLLIEAIKDGQNLREKIRGTISVSHVAMAELCKINNRKAKSTARNLLENWREPDRSDLIWFLESENIETADFAKRVEFA